jgi:hypothetical protein
MTATLTTDAPVDLGLSYVPYLKPRFASADLVGAAAALLTPAAERWTGREDVRRHRITVAPGAVVLAVTDPARAERLNNDDLGPLGWSRDSLGRIVGPPRDDGSSLLALDGLAPFLSVAEPGAGDRTPSRCVAGWSARSRSRMVKTFAMLDYAPMFAGGLAPAMVTLTLPGDWRSVAPTGRVFKRLQNAWNVRLDKAWGPQPMLWKLEFQSRGAAHLHLFMSPPHGYRVCRCRLCGRPGRRLVFRDWLSHSWADVVGCADARGYADHVKAGTGIDYSEGLKASDPRRLAVYFSKHGGAAGGKEYQHDVPAEWQEPGAGPGRFWGYRRLSPAVATVEIEPADFVAFKRVLRRWSERQAFYPAGHRYPTRVDRRSSVVAVDRVDTRTGVVRKRRVNRPRRYLGGASGGGFVLPNDGPSFVAALARYQEVLSQ